ncbi:UDP-galactose UDP-glucose transporter 5 [Micractinium conductrix]|uniref:UDP-galactose UDP-glucose transporter 5 n=1 Tax=Micractinium conductrix TaxID=554055 RepID=A0A2P6VRS5_9CHLO|nr:UDP-galactose UDP-glucose transporter 5 [Micractinium conductrix]|eukprot:PSC76775.1 UDP-galactose UDP-glucose transporter 5 [Micractinium conductrix]
MQGSFGGETFTYSLFLVLCNRLTTMTVALSMLLMYGQDLRPVAPPYNYAAVSVSNVVATFCQYEALKHVSFPMQTLGKCAKMIPVMIWGTIIMRKRYGPKDYMNAALITLGCTLFLMTGSVKSKHASSDSSMFGLALMLGYLGFDGFTSTFQDKLFKGYQMTIYNQILYVTSFSAIFSLLGLVSAGQLMPALSFVSRHPEALFVSRHPEALASIMMLSGAATVGQLFISHTIKTFGALLFATVMTTRQFISILLSCILFAHPLTAGQWLGTVMVFGALYYKSLARGGSHGKPKAADAAHDGPGGDAEKLPLVSSGAVGDAEATEGAAPLK